MSDETQSATPNSGAQGTAAGGSSEKAAPQAPPIQILHQYVKDFSFENPSTPQIQPTADSKVDVKIDVTANAVGEKLFEIALHCEFRAHMDEGEEKKTLYLGELVYAGLVRIGEMRPQDVEPYLFIQIPQMLFPYAREIVSGATRDGGFPPLLLAPFDFIELFRRRIAARAEALKAENGKSENGKAEGKEPSAS